MGGDFFTRRGWAVARSDAEQPRGLVDQLSALAHPKLDVAAVHPDLRWFFERTADLETLALSRWCFPFNLVWPLLRLLFLVMGQLVLPVRRARFSTQVLALDTARDGRPDARAVVRRRAEDGSVFQVVAYATWERGGTRLMSAAFPLPGAQLAGFLRLDPLAADERGRLAVALRSRAGDGDDAGIWLVFGAAGPRPKSVRLPLSEELELWPPAHPNAPVFPGALPQAPLIVGVHRQSLWGMTVVTHHYAMWPLVTPRADRRSRGLSSADAPDARPRE